MSTEFEEPQRLISQSCTELEMAILRAGCDVPSDAGRQARVMAAVGVGTAVALGTKSTWAMVAGWKKAVLGGAIACSSVGGVYAYSALVSPDVASIELTSRGGAPAPAVAEEPDVDVIVDQAVLPSEAEVEVVEVHESASVVEPPPKRRNVAPKKARSAAPEHSAETLQEEVEALDGARSSLRTGDSSGALRGLAEYSKRFPKGSLRLEAEALRIEALAASGNHVEASRRAKRILERSPNSVLAPRLRRFVID